MTVLLERQDVSQLCISVSVDHQLDAAGAEAEILLLCAPEDSTLPRLDPACGQWVTVSAEGTTLFTGRVERVSFDAKALALTLNCLDPLSLLAKNDCRGPFEGTPAQIAAEVCNSCGLELGSAWETGQPLRLSASCERSAFSVIRSVYGRCCVLDYRDGKVQIREKGARRAVLPSGQLLALTARNTVEEAATEVCVYSGGSIAAVASDPEGEKQYGRRSKNQYLSLEYPSAEEQARAELRGVSRQARLTVSGLCPVRCGEILSLDQPMLGVYGDYLVTETVCRCRKGLLTTELGAVSV